MQLEPVLLEGRSVRLEPLEERHFPALIEIGLDREIWKWTPNQPFSPEAVLDYLVRALQLRNEGAAVPFATIDKKTGKVAGTTRFGNIERAHKKCEVGWTWLGLPWQRTALNTEAKYLMLRHGFETCGLYRVEFKTDELNDKSRNALARIGAKFEGTFRSHVITEGGRRRNTVWFSILDSDWPEVKTHLEGLIARRIG